MMRRRRARVWRETATFKCQLLKIASLFLKLVQRFAGAVSAFVWLRRVPNFINLAG